MRELLQANVDLGVIEKVPEGVPTKWCSRMVIQPKKSGNLRMTVDLTKVNDVTYSIYEKHSLPKINSELFL